MADELRVTFRSTVRIPEGVGASPFDRARFLLKAEEGIEAAHQALVDAVGEVTWDVKVQEVTPRKRGDAGDEPAGDGGGDAGEQGAGA